ncbi:ribosome biogenesis GTPase Der [bacterium]|nr:ribosome biogenesis GTPase Der [candidate division CSSED10-310 bacterium]
MGDIRLAIVGRVNVGKSTLFNRLTRSRDAIVESTPGVTRDRKEGRLTLAGRSIILVDTGGIDAEVIDSKPADEAQKQSLIAISEADICLFVVDVRAGILPGDTEIAERLRRSGKPVILLANKVDSDESPPEIMDFYRLGFGDPLPVSAEHNINIFSLLKRLGEWLNIRDDDPEMTIPQANETRIAVIGRPNVGKSSFLNSIIGAERHIVTDVPGTTRDAVDSIITYQGRRYRLIDTAGLKRLGRTREKLEKIAAIMARRSIERSDIVLLLFDSQEGVTAQDTKIASYIIEAGKSVIIIGNKWDLTSRTSEDHKRLEQEVRDAYVSMPWAPFMVMSALEGHNVQKVLPRIDEVIAQAAVDVSTSRLNKIIHDAQLIHPPPRRDNRHSIRFYYAAQINQRPPTFLLFTNTRSEIHFSYRRFLANQIRSVYPFEGWPIRLVFRHKHDERGHRWD